MKNYQDSKIEKLFIANKNFNITPIDIKIIQDLSRIHLFF